MAFWSRSGLALQWVAVGLLAFLLPFTSFPLVARLTGSSMVAPLSLLPLLVLLLVWLLPYLLRRGALPFQAGVLMAFVLAVLFSTAAALFLPIPTYKDQSVLPNTLETLATLAVGLSFYLVAAGWPGQHGAYERLRFLMRWINWGGALMLSWSLVQAAVWFRFQNYPDWMWLFQEQVSTSLLLFGQRINGFAYEPSWLAHQLNMLYLPLWLAAVINGFSAHRFRLWKLHVEHFLLAGGLLVLVLSISRVGQLAFLLMIAYLVLLLNLRVAGWLRDALFRRLRLTPAQLPRARQLYAVVSLLALVVFYAALLFGAGFALSKFDTRMARLFDFSVLRESSFMHYANNLVFAERIVFWEAGWKVFNDHPILGVGLGNAGFFFPEKLSNFSYALTEVRTLLYQWTSLPNIKSLWIRLLAETGLLGFAFFVGWYYVLWKTAQFLRAWNDRLLRTLGLAGALVLVGFLIEGFSVDTFALPYYWISFGLLSAAGGLASRWAAAAPAGLRPEDDDEMIGARRSYDE